MPRVYSFPEGHWNWPVRLTHKHAVKADGLIYTGGQVDLDPSGRVRHPNDLDPQVQGSLDYIEDLLKDLDAGVEDLVKFVVYFVGDDQDETRILDMIADWIGLDVKPVISTVRMPELCYEDMLVEIEAVAIVGKNGGAAQRVRLRLDELPKLHQAFSHVVRCGEMIFTSDMSAITPSGEMTAPDDITAQTKIMMDQLCRALIAVGADAEDVLKLNVFYVGNGTAEDWEKSARIRADYFPDPGPAPTGIPVLEFAQQGLTTKIAVTAKRGMNGERLETTYSWPEGHWDWTAPLPYKHGNKCGNIIHVGGQVSLDQNANVIDPDDMVAQTRTAMDNIARVLAEFGATLDDVVKVTTFYQGNASAEALHENLQIRSNSYTEPGPATTGVPVPCLVYEHMIIEIEVIAILDH